ncbi:MAG: prolyl oligopeptidase family serine peptidase [Acidobacteria bacterium]|nr:prolyl oligopeptidase family serine peptidase [Acidobacteriota bacterium]
MAGEVDDDELYFRFSSFTETPRVYRFDFATATVRPWIPFAVAGAEAPALRTAPLERRGFSPGDDESPATPLERRGFSPGDDESPATPLERRGFSPGDDESPATSLERRGFSPGDCETRQVWYASKDGTRVSMFLVHARGLPRDGQRPVLLSAYGGFNISLTPQYDPANFVWLERGGVVAVPNLRGGGEYGEGWHRAGMLDRKQNVFDDFISAAEWLMTEGYTTPARLAIEGGSNGGLLVGAALVQRPDLFGAVVCRVPVVDMLRYHRFTVGRFWIPEYGSADDPSQFPFLYAYSPLHHVRDGQRYPATLVMTADTDDRVDPGMAKKFTARLQAATAGVGGAGPILIRVETRAGHGAGKPVAKLLDEEADIHAFLRQALRLDI